MSRTTFYLSEEDTREFYRLVSLENELYKIQNVCLDDQWNQLALGMFNLAWKCAPSQVFTRLLTESGTSFQDVFTLNHKAYDRLRKLVQPFVPTWLGSKN